MPTYEFKCSNCDENFTEIQSFDDCDKIPPCPKCNTFDNVRKVWKAIPFEFGGAKKYGIKK